MGLSYLAPLQHIAGRIRPHFSKIKHCMCAARVGWATTQHPKYYPIIVFKNGNLKKKKKKNSLLHPIEQTGSELCFCFTVHSSRGSSKAGGGRGPKLHGPEGDVALLDARQAERSDPWLPGALCARGKRRVEGPAPHQGCHAG